MANNNDALQQILKYETSLMQKMLNLMVKLLTSFKQGITELLSHQSMGTEKLSNIIHDVEKISEEQTSINMTIKQLENQLINQKAKNIELINNLGEQLANKILQVNDNLYKVQQELMNTFNTIQDNQSKQLLDVLKQQLNIQEKEESKKIETEADIRKEKIRQKFALWSAIAVGIIGGLFGIIQLILKLRG